MSKLIINKKKVIHVRDKPKHIPRQLPPMERPETPRVDLRSSSSARESNLHNVSLSRFSNLNEAGVSSFEVIIDLFKEAKNTDDLAYAVQSFESAAQNLEESKNFAPCDLEAYHTLYPMLSPLINTAPGHILIQLVSALKHILNAINGSKTVKPKPPTTPKTGKTSNRLKKLEPLPPLDSETSNSSNSDQSVKPPTEHFNIFMSKILYKMSTDNKNDEIFLNPDLVGNIISLSGSSHDMETRIYSVASLKNETHNENFRNLLVKISNFSELFKVFNAKSSNPKLQQQCAAVMRNLITDTQYIDLIIKNNIHILLIKSMNKFTNFADYCYVCFRILTKISGRDDVRQSIFKEFTESGILTLFYTLIDKHKNHSLLLSRLSYVFADFASHEPTFISLAGQITEPLSISVITNALDDAEVLSNVEVSTLLVQVVANLSVDKECASLLAFGTTISSMLAGRTFKEDDRLGYNLLCTASNFTFHDHYWSPKELIDALPVAFISQYVPSIIEALRTLCNLALAPNSMLVESKIFELLGILIKHIDPDVVLYSLQTLANLINHAGIRRRFRSAGLVESLLDLLRSDDLDELELEAIAALIMNFGAITLEEAQNFYNALDEFEIPPDADIPNAFKDFLKQQMRVDC